MISISEGDLVGVVCSLVWATSATIVRTQSFKVSPGGGLVTFTTFPSLTFRSIWQPTPQ